MSRSASRLGFEADDAKCMTSVGVGGAQTLVGIVTVREGNQASVSKAALCCFYVVSVFTPWLSWHVAIDLR